MPIANLLKTALRSTDDSAAAARKFTAGNVPISRAKFGLHNREFDLPGDSFIFRHDQVVDKDTPNPRVMGRIVGRVYEDGMVDKIPDADAVDDSRLFVMSRTDEMEEPWGGDSRVPSSSVEVGHSLRTPYVHTNINQFSTATPLQRKTQRIVGASVDAGRTGLGTMTGVHLTRSIHSDRSPKEVAEDDISEFREFIDSLKRRLP